MGAVTEDRPVMIEEGICHECRHRLSPLTCRAFPERIPAEILRGKFDHRKPYPGDGDIRFERGVPEQEKAG